MIQRCHRCVLLLHYSPMKMVERGGYAPPTAGCKPTVILISPTPQGEVHFEPSMPQHGEVTTPYVYAAVELTPRPRESCDQRWWHGDLVLPQARSVLETNLRCWRSPYEMVGMARLALATYAGYGIYSAAL